jgi:hypothetical protein
MKLSIPLVILALAGSSFAFAQPANPQNAPESVGIAQHNDGHRDGGHGSMVKATHRSRRHAIHHRRIQSHRSRE